MTRFHALLLLLLASPVALADEFATGCKKAATEVLCAGHTDCSMDSIMERSKKGNDSEKGGYEECKEFALFVKEFGISLEAKRAQKRLKDKLAAFNKEIQKDFPFITVTADFDRYALEDMYTNARYMDHYNVRDQRERSIIAALSSSDKSTEFEMRYLNPIKTALYNVGKDQEGKDVLKAKVSEIKLGFYCHGRTAERAEMKMTGKTLVVPGVWHVDQTSFASSVQAFLEKQL